MPIKDKDRKARANYARKVRRMVIDLFPTDEDIKTRLQERVDAGEPKASYIKRLIREEIAKEEEK